jgi:hypothetical protein
VLATSPIFFENLDFFSTRKKDLTGLKGFRLAVLWLLGSTQIQFQL